VVSQVPTTGEAAKAGAEASAAAAASVANTVFVII
jgi:hypothetical protein